MRRALVGSLCPPLGGGTGEASGVSASRDIFLAEVSFHVPGVRVSKCSKYRSLSGREERFTCLYMYVGVDTLPTVENTIFQKFVRRGVCYLIIRVTHQTVERESVPHKN